MRPSKKTTESKKTKEGLTWFTMPPKDEKEKRKGGRRATEGDTVGEMVGYGILIFIDSQNLLRLFRGKE